MSRKVLLLWLLATVHPLSAAVPAQPEIKRSFDFPDAEVREVISAIGSAYDVRMVLEKNTDLRGRVSILVQDVTLDQMLTATLSSIGHGYRREDGTVVIYKLPETGAAKFWPGRR